MSAQQEDNGLRATLSEALDKAESGGGGGAPASPAAEPSKAAPTPSAGATLGTPTGATASDAPTPFKASSEGALPGVLKGEQPSSAATVELKAPASWKPAMRENWGKLGRDVQEEVLRREHEINSGLSEASQARRFHRDFAEATQPFQHLLHLGGLNPVQNVTQLLSTVNDLRMGSPYQRSEILAKIIMDYGADLPTLDSALAQMLGKGGPATANGGAGGNPVMSEVDRLIEQRMGPINELMAHLRQNGASQQQQTLRSAQTDLQDFVNNPANEYVRDVATDMADIIDLATAQGKRISLQDAYRKATMLHPEISQIVAQRSLQAAVAKRTEEANAALGAGGGITPTRGTPASGSGDGDDLRASILRSMSALS